MEIVIVVVLKYCLVALISMKVQTDHVNINYKEYFSGPLDLLKNSFKKTAGAIIQ